MKKILSLFFVIILFISATGCSSDTEPAGASTQGAVTEESFSAGESDDSMEETASGQFETAEIKLINELYDENEMDFINSIQGNITNIDNGGTFPVLIANNKFYSEDYGTLKERFALPELPDSMIYFNNSSIGENLFYFKDGKLSLYPSDEYGIRFTNIPFQEETDFVAEIGMSSYFTIVRQENGGYIIDYYESENGSDEFVLRSQNPVSIVETSDIVELSVQKIIPLHSNLNGYDVYILTDNNDVYVLDSVNSNGSMTTMSSTPILSNVDRIVAPSDVATYLTVPIYSKIGDNANLYSSAPGPDLIETSDNFEISFILPDGHTPEEVTDVFRVSDMLIFVFSNGDTYFTDDIEKEERSSYEMTKLDDVSQLKANGTILDMAGATTFDDNLYMLMSDGKLYYKPL